MKIRSGFVSNSSSSSFIISLKKIPDSVEELMKMMGLVPEFYASHIPDPPLNAEDYKRLKLYSRQDIAQRIFHDMQDEKPLTKDQVVEKLVRELRPPGIRYNDFEDPVTGRTDWKAYDKAKDAIVRPMAEADINAIDPGWVTIELKYADDNGSEFEGLLEHLVMSDFQDTDTMIVRPFSNH
jgi:hypothetical protein